MQELEDLLGSLGKAEVGGSSGSSMILGDDAKMSRIKERRISRRLATGEIAPKAHVEPTPSLAPPPSRPGHTSGIQDLDFLMQELGAGGGESATQSLSSLNNNTKQQPPVQAQPATQSLRMTPKPAPAGGDDIDALVASLGMPVQRPSVGAPKPAPARGPTDDIDALMASIGATPSAPQQRPLAAPKPTSASLPSDDIDALMAALGPSPAAPTQTRTPVPVQTRQPAPVQTRAPAGGGDDIDALMASLGAAPPKPKPAPARQPPGNNIDAMMASLTLTSPKPQPTHVIDDPLLGDINDIMSSLGPTTPLPTNTPSMRPAAATASADPDLDALIGSLNPDTRTTTVPQQRVPQPITPGRGPQQNFPPQNMQVGGQAKGTCATCRRPIYAQMMQALGKAYHPDCFVCGNCGDSLGTSSFFQAADGTPNCRRCYEALFCARCGHCDQPIQGPCMTAVGKKWHVDCFICSQCLRPFGTNLVYEKEGSPFCESCFYGIFSSRCAGCDQPIKADCINACGKQWHVEHFACNYCKKAFGTEPYFEHAGLPYCKLHYHQQQGSLCGCGCGRPVMGRVVQALGKQWLPEHFICAFCMNGLAGQTFTERDAKAYCSTCYGKLFN